MSYEEPGETMLDERIVSKLGTKSYWDERYKMELQNFEEHLDEGEVWFGRSAENRAIKYLVGVGLPSHSRIIDLGCGNGSLLRRLRLRGFSSLLGVDYCSDAIALAKAVTVQEERDSDQVLPTIDYQVVDLLEPNLSVGTFEVLLDKGTWDAVSLSDDYEQRLSAYRSFVDRSLTAGGKFVIFSCNYVKDELCKQFCLPSLRFQAEIQAEHTYSFGGKKGVTSTGVIFEKNG